jgi:transmembrane sensor
VTKADDQTPRIDPLVDEALDWVLLLRSGRATTADAQALQSWRDASPDHEQAFREAARLLRDLRDMAGELEKDRQRRRLGARLSRNHRGLLGRGGLPGSRPTDYRTRKGEQSNVTLAGDISLKLNTLTRIAVRGTEDKPQIELISGEVAITVKGTPSGPLVVLAAEGRMTATRAVWNARCTDGVVSATCIDGAVAVEHGGRQVELRKGRQVAYSHPDGLGPTIDADAEVASAWQEGLLIFRDRPLTLVIDELNRYRPGRVIMMNAKLGRCLVNGTFRLDRLEDLVAELQRLFGVRRRSLPGGIMLLS